MRLTSHGVTSREAHICRGHRLNTIEVWDYVVGRAPHADEVSANCAMSGSRVDVAWIRRVVPEADTNRSRWPTDPAWQLVQAAPFSEAPTNAHRLIRREQHVHADAVLHRGRYWGIGGLHGWSLSATYC